LLCLQAMRYVCLALALAVVGCSASVSAPSADGGNPTPPADSGQPGGNPDGGNDAGNPTDAGSLNQDAGNNYHGDGGGFTPQGTLSGDFRVDNIGWRTQDTKVAVIKDHGGASVELISLDTGMVVNSYTASATQTESTYSGDQYGTVDFSAVTTPGDYYLYIPSESIHSYSFRISDDVYNIVGAAAVKMYYFQRCTGDKALPYATDALLGFSGGGQWVDGMCHVADLTVGAGPGSVDNGQLNIPGGWHDAGDYQKTLWSRGVPALLFAYEINPSVWADGQLNVPESGNGIPDILDEAKWELDFYVLMQRPDGHFMTSLKGDSSTATHTSPPSAANEKRYYFDYNDGGSSPNGYPWSGGGVTVGEATGNAVLSLAHAATVFRAIGQKTIGDGYAAVAATGWTWLNSYNGTQAENELKAAAASAVFRMDPTNTSAQAVADAFAWGTFDGSFNGTDYGVPDPGDQVMMVGAFHYILNSSGTASVQAACKTAVGAVMDYALSVDGPYGGMSGGVGNAWDWSWGSSQVQTRWGANLFMAAKLGIYGSHTQAEMLTRAQKNLHFMLGLNPLNMLYMTNMATYGGEHSSFQIFHSWFSNSDALGGDGNAQYNGKPTGVDEPLYPYYAGDTQTSTYGPAPGFVPGGPNLGYGGSITLPSTTYPAYAYRDYSEVCPNNNCTTNPWELTEPDVNYQGGMAMLLSFVMSPAQ
jgi:endoglucanase